MKYDQEVYEALAENERNKSARELIEALDQRYGNPYMAKEYGLIQQAIEELRKIQDEKCQGK
jgi:lauroyl/myristoyl acyltransferase